MADAIVDHHPWLKEGGYKGLNRGRRWVLQQQIIANSINGSTRKKTGRRWARKQGMKWRRDRPCYFQASTASQSRQHIQCHLHFPLLLPQINSVISCYIEGAWAVCQRSCFWRPRLPHLYSFLISPILHIPSRFTGKKAHWALMSWTSVHHLS